MTPEERINKYTWSVLQDLKDEILLATEGKPIEIELTSAIGAGIPSKDTQIKIVRKLAEQKAVKVLELHEPSWQGPRGWFKLQILQPKFDEIYIRYKKLCSNDLGKNRIYNESNDQKEDRILTGIVNIPVKVIIADLKSKYQEIEQEKNQVQFFIKIAHYGRYILENQVTISTLNSLYQESKNDAKPYIHACEQFIKEWKKYAEDLLEKSKIAGIEENPDNPLDNDAGRVKNGLNLIDKKQDPSLWDFDLDYFFTPYQYLVWQFDKIGKSDLLIPKHFDKGGQELKIHPLYSNARNEWDKFKYSREAKVWWAHYQVCRLAAGILDLKERANYFKDDNVIDGFYKQEFSELARGNSINTPIVLHKNKYEVWIKRLHEYLMPRLEDLTDQENKPQQSKPIGFNKLVFYPDDGIAEYRGIQYTFKGKTRALLKFLNQSKHTPFSLDYIKEKCNPFITNSKYHFKGDKDTRDTVNYIRKMLKVNDGEFFPIQKRENNWIWLEKQ